MELLLLVGRTVLLYLVIVLIFRLMGKREIGELSILDLVVFLMIAEIAVMAIEDTESPLLNNFLPMATLTVLQIGFAVWALKNQHIRRILDGRASIIIENGQIREREMKKQRYNFNDLLIQLREKDISNIEDVEFAILETSGKLSVIKKDQGVKSLTLPLILDGIIQFDHLERSGKDLPWLQKEMGKRGYSSFEKISYCSFNQGKFYIDEKDIETH
ncbi:DUF421 domain-containing protein [Priestia filamentosa]|uniref:YetF C-terminal domain-containing protein n=1 Tax=Priestia filamentosa TaxID=1402861 RepID=A0A1X7CV63_9BACI|nr:DUF421 domain-containing protein [Priestia filamentosa]AKO94257.1 hypothetical protein BEH_20455 [Priestia filamentosa]MDT3764534.1 DUF421 domain-containing protein [Priestia filamentosa]OXS71016.1 DUF421 domain-containing protein [Priestia filamentosa]WRU94883.1 DUF421 domain-containing protein [Priestia filamentosa]SMF03709.1 Uncharacterized membrane protein YcaP, DUF421 family [Priestia filamentosa]